MNQENVLDETYRKARKLDLENFALNFSPEELGFHGIIKKALLTPANRTIVFEKYKINIYGACTNPRVRLLGLIVVIVLR